MDEGWIGRARRRLVALADAGAWGYRLGGNASAEPTVLAALGLLATARPSDAEAWGLAARAGERLAASQRRDGSLGSAPTADAPGWPTPFALLLWRALGRFEEARDRATRWLLGERVATTSRSAGTDPVVGHDASIPAWPWVEGTHAWVEPTALSILALAREGVAGHRRVGQGVRLLRDRAIAAGGWNYGNTVVFGHALRPQPGPTGLALLALAAAGASRGEVGPSLDYLRGVLPTVRAAGSLGWGVLGLRAWGELPDEAGGWLAESAQAVLGRDDAGPRLGLLLIASGASALHFFVPEPAR